MYLLGKQAKKMLKVSAKIFKTLEIGTNVKVPISNVDCSKTSPRNVIAVVIEFTDDMYKLGTSAGILKPLCIRSEIYPSPVNLFDLSSVDLKKL